MSTNSNPLNPDQPKPIDLKTGLAQERTSLAAQRVELALDRTTLAWIRTTLSMVSFGLGVIGFFRSLSQSKNTPETIHMHEVAIQFGYSLLIIGVIATVLCAITHWRALRKLKRGEMPDLPKWSLSLTLAFLISLLGLGALWSLLSR